MDVIEFSNSLQIKFACFANKNNTIEMQLEIMKEVFLMLLTPFGREYTGKQNNFRNILKVKVEEYMKDPHVDPNGQFMAISLELLDVIRDLNNL